MKRKEMLKKIEERHQQTMTIQEILEFIQKRINEANEELDGGEYTYGRFQALKDLHHELFWDGVDMA
jgi:hypothetical protein